MFVHEAVELTEMNVVTTEKGRKYRTPEGVDLPSITTVLSILSRDSIAKWRKRVGEKEANRISGKASGRGTRVHEITEKYINNETNSYFINRPTLQRRNPDHGNRHSHQPHLRQRVHFCLLTE